MSLKRYIEETAKANPKIQHIVSNITIIEVEKKEDDKPRGKEIHLKKHGGIKVSQIVPHKPITRF